MGYDNNNAGIHMIPHNYKASFDSVDEYDKYAAMLVESKNKTSKNIVHRYRTATDMILKENNVVLWERKGESQNCECGCKLEFQEKIELKYFHQEKEVLLTTTGKICRRCKKKYVVRKILMEATQLK